jgi:hypothetical protein
MKQLATHFNPLGHRKIDERNLQFCDYIGHYINVPPDDGQPNVFSFHFPRGKLSKEMTGYELADEVMRHMSAILGMGLMRDNPRIEKEFRAMFDILVMTGRPDRSGDLIASEVISICDHAVVLLKQQLREHIVARTCGDPNSVKVIEARIVEWDKLRDKAVKRGVPTAYERWLIVSHDLATDAGRERRKQILDRLLSWIRVEWGQEDDDIIYMSLFDKTPVRDAKIISLPD